MSEIEIETNIAVETRMIYPLKELQEGESFFVALDGRDIKKLRSTVASSVYRIQRLHKAKFAIKTIKDEQNNPLGMRVWCVKSVGSEFNSPGLMRSEDQTCNENYGKRPTVYLIQDSDDKNFTPAMRHGRISTLLPKKYQVYHDAIEAVEILKEKLSEFSDADCLLLAGDPILIGMAFSIAAKNNSGRVNILKWDRQERSYHSIPVRLG